MSNEQTADGSRGDTAVDPTPMNPEERLLMKLRTFTTLMDQEGVSGPTVEGLLLITGLVSAYGKKQIDFQTFLLKLKVILDVLEHKGERGLRNTFAAYVREYEADVAAASKASTAAIERKANAIALELVKKVAAGSLTPEQAKVEVLNRIVPLLTEASQTESQMAEALSGMEELFVRARSGELS